MNEVAAMNNILTREYSNIPNTTGDLLEIGHGWNFSGEVPLLTAS